MNLDLVAANLWKDNRHIIDDLRLLDRCAASIIVTNESALFIDDIRANVKNYEVFVETRQRASSQNTIWLRRGALKGFASGSRKMCDAVGPSPERHALWVGFWFDGLKCAVIGTHANSRIQAGPHTPRDLPRVDELIEHVQNLNELRKWLYAEGYDIVIIAGDLNWDYVPGPMFKQWRYAPRRYFARWGMTTNWSATSAPKKKGTHGRRQIDYVAFPAKAMRAVAQQWVRGEHSDHNWIRVTLRLRSKFAHSRRARYYQN